MNIYIFMAHIAWRDCTNYFPISYFSVGAGFPRALRPVCGLLYIPYRHSTSCQAHTGAPVRPTGEPRYLLLTGVPVRSTREPRY
jgi:hypothetical protein